MTNMSTKEAAKIGIQLGVLRELLPQYSHRTLDNIIQGLEARLAEYGITHKATLVGFPQFDEELKECIDRAAPYWQGVDVDKYLAWLRGYSDEPFDDEPIGETTRDNLMYNGRTELLND